MTHEPAVRSPLRWLRRGKVAIHLLVRFLGALAVANLQQARIVLGRPRAVRPRWIRFVDDLPKTATGKIQRFRLPAG